MLLRWVRTAELIRIKDIDINFILLMNATWISSLDDLWDTNNEALAKGRHSAEKDLGLKVKFPNKLDWWIDQAQRMSSQVEP